MLRDIQPLLDDMQVRGLIGFSPNSQIHHDQLLTVFYANDPFGGSQSHLTIKRLSNAAMNAAIFCATKNPPVLRADYVIDIVSLILVAGAGFEPAAFRL
jgi:hypothetical protein